MNSYARIDRNNRIDRRADLRICGRTPSKSQYVYRVQTEVIALPDWALEHTVRDISSTEECVWFWSGSLARKLCRLDQDEGGHPDLMRLRARRCPVCGLLRLGLLAGFRAELDESAVDGRKLPCNPECLTRVRQQKGQI